LRQKITSIQIKQKRNLTETPFIKTQKDRITVGILVDTEVKKNDKIFRLEAK
jgi:hypothetical protein